MTENREIAASWLRAFQMRDIAQLNLADDFVHTSPFGAIRGKDSYLELIRKNEEAFFANEITIVDFIESSDRFAVRYCVGEMDACDVIYVRDGKIAEVYSYYHFGEKPVM